MTTKEGGGGNIYNDKVMFRKAEEIIIIPVYIYVLKSIFCTHMY